MPRIITRVIIDLLMFLCVMQGWWFAALPLGIVGALMFPFFIELVIAGVVYDALFGFAEGQGFVGYVGTVVSVAFIFVVVFVKKMMR